jgi:hypothetical protein
MHKYPSKTAEKRHFAHIASLNMVLDCIKAILQNSKESDRAQRAFLKLEYKNILARRRNLVREFAGEKE